MKKIIQVLILGLTVGLSNAVFAASSSAYMGVKGGLMLTSISDLSSATNIGGVIGYHISGSSGLAIEAEFTFTAIAGDASFSSEWDVTTAAVYLAYRSAGDMYFKTKVGFLNEDVTISNDFFGVSGTDSGASYGVGFGKKLGGSNSVEVELTIIEEDINFLSVGYNFDY